MMPGALRASIARGVIPRLPTTLGRYARRSFLAMDRTPESMFFDNFASIRLADQQQLLAPGLRESATRAGAYGASLDYFNKDGAARCSIASRGHQDVSRRAADDRTR
jgi:hypothetical protein